MEVIAILKALALIVGPILAFLGIRKYGVSQKKIGRQEGLNEAREVNNESFKDLAEDVLDGGHPWRVRDDEAAEVTCPRTDTPKRMAQDLRPEGEEDRLARDRNGSS
jgi:hypothetical protein